MAVDQSWKGVYRLGGVSLFGGGVILVVFLLSVFIFRVDLPLAPQAVLENPVPPRHPIPISSSRRGTAAAWGVGTLSLIEGCQEEQYADSRRSLVDNGIYVPCLPRSDYIPAANKQQIHGYQASSREQHIWYLLTVPLK